MIIGIDGNEANIKEAVGSNIYALKLLQHLNKLNKNNFFTVYLKTSPNSNLPQGSQNWSYKILKPGKLWTRWRLPLDLYLHKPRSNVFFTPGHYAPKFCPSPLAISIMDLSFLHFPEMFRKKDLYTLLNWTKDSIERANHIFTISQFSKNDIIKNYSIPEEKITVTYPGFENKLYFKNITQEEIDKVKEKYQIKNDYILHIGTLQPRKNLRKLIQAFADLDTKNLSLVISGKKGWFYKEILEESKKLKISSKVIFTGFVSQEEKIKLLKGANFMALISLYEGFGIPVVEAMAVGCPVVVSNTSSLPEIAGDHNIQVNPTSVKSITRGLHQALQLNEDQRKEIIVKNDKLLTKYSWQKTATKTLEVLYDIAV